MKKEIAHFYIYYTQILDPLGQLSESLPKCLQDPKLRVQLYRALVHTRMFDKKAITLQRTGLLGTYPSTLGQEAIGVGLGAAMNENDVFCPYYRELGAQLWRLVTMKEILLYWGGDERGSSFSDNKFDFPMCVPIASQLLHAVGVAKAIQLREESRVVVTAVGDGGTSRGDFYEAINLAGVWKLPVVFVVNNNQWAISVSREKQTASSTIAQKAIAAGIPCEQVDGNDVFAVFDSVSRALRLARSGQGPSLIEAITYRMGDHTTADDATRYRSRDECSLHEMEDPILRMYHYLTNNNLWNSNLEVELKASITNEIEQAVAEYQAINLQDPAVIFEHHYQSTPKELFRQREEFREFIHAKKPAGEQ